MWKYVCKAAYPYKQNRFYSSISIRIKSLHKHSCVAYVTNVNHVYKYMKNFKCRLKNDCYEA